MYLPSIFRPLTARSSRPRVLLIQTGADDRVLRGVDRYACERGWLLDFSTRWTGGIPAAPLQSWDGVIADFSGAQPRLKLPAPLHELPLVTLGGEAPEESVSSVRTPLQAIARLAARHFAERGFANCGFVFTEATGEEPMLSEAFAAALPKTMQFHPVRADRFTQLLDKLPKPVAFLAANDLVASSIVRICEEMEWKVPEDVAVLGIGDDTLLCTLGHVAVSSIDCSSETRGYNAAALLDKAMISGERVESLLVPPAGVVVRRSTDTFAFPHPAATRVFRFIRDNFQQAIDTQDIERVAGADFRRVQYHFQKHLGRTVVQELTRLRLERSKTLLADEQMSLEQIALKSGFSHRFHFERVFTRQYGRTPRNYRQTLHAEPETISAERPAFHYAEA